MANLLQLITPTNLEEQRELFLSGKIENPVFNYRWQQDDFDKEVVTSLNSRKLALLKAVIAGDPVLIDQTAKQNFQIADYAGYLDRAEADIAQTPEANQETLAGFLTGLEQCLQFLGLDYEVKVVDSHAFNVRPNSIQKQILVSKHLNLDFFSADSVLKHELTHIIRFENGQYNNLKRQAGYLLADEGLVSFFQEKYGKNGKAARFQHALEYLSSGIAEAAEFQAVYQYFQEHGFAENKAWGRAARHKFGYTDTAKPGDIWKPASYYYFARKIEILSEVQQFALLSGKILLSDLVEETERGKINEYQGRWPLAKVREFYQMTWA